MFDFGIEGYRPRWLSGHSAVRAAHGRRLRALVGRPLTGVWLVWDRQEDAWFPDCPVLLDFCGEQVEINHAGLDDLSLTWNTVDPCGPLLWPGFDLCWRDDAYPEAGILRGRPLGDVELLEQGATDTARGVVDVVFRFPHGSLTLLNALDENGMALGPADPGRRWGRGPTADPGPWPVVAHTRPSAVR